MTHYHRARRNGTTDDKTPTFSQRFWAKVKKTETCWTWTAYRDPQGYGTFSVGPRATHAPHRAHRVAWELTNGQIPDGSLVLHRCDNPSCVNPKHLFLGTHQDNQRDKVAKGRQATGLRNGKHTKPEKTPRGDNHWRRSQKLNQGEVA
jgi:hypothetical protein